MIELFIAFSAGLISFLSPCVLPLIPGYISYISGNSLNELIEKKNVNLIPIVLFTLGFSIVFIIFGAASTFLGQVLLQNSYELRMVAGLIIILKVIKKKNVRFIGCIWGWAYKFFVSLCTSINTWLFFIHFR